jgi:hypothetical protein
VAWQQAATEKTGVTARVDGSLLAANVIGLSRASFPLSNKSFFLKTKKQRVW